VQITKAVSSSLSQHDALRLSSKDTAVPGQFDPEKLITTLRTLVQRTFTALLTSTSSPSPSGAKISFLRVLRAFLARASVSSPNLSDLRAVLTSIFSAYAYEESILSLADRLLDKDLFLNVKAAAELRQRGWRPRGSVCERCRKRVWGPGAAGDIFRRWEEKQDLDAARKLERRAILIGGTTSRGKDKARTLQSGDASRTGRDDNGKGKEHGDLADVDTDGEEQDDNLANEPKEEDLGPIVVLACRHIYHQACLEAVLAGDRSDRLIHDGREFRCPIDG